MAHFAQLDDNNIVVRVDVVDNNDCVDLSQTEQEGIGVTFLKSIHGGNTHWKQTSYNKTFRKKFAAIGDTYDEIKDAFVSAKPFASWTYNEETGDWQPPTPLPEDFDVYDNPYRWNESTKVWDKVR